MNPTERIIAVTEGKELDRVQTMSVLYDQHPAHQILGFPKRTDADLINSWYGQMFLKKWGNKRIGRFIAKQDVKRALYIGIETAVKLGFDAAWAIWGPNFSRFPDPNTIQDDWGNYNNIVFDDFGNASYYYREPKITSPEAYEQWSFFPDPDDYAKKTCRFFKKLLSKYGNKICICADIFSSPYQAMFLSIGFEKLIEEVLQWSQKRI